MPRFFFHIHDDLDSPDPEGAELPDIGAAQAYARQAARTLTCETLTQDGRISLHHRIDIENDGHERVGSVLFGDAVEIKSTP